MAVLHMCNEKYAIQPVFMAKQPKFLCLKGNWGWGTRWWQFSDQK